MLLRDRGRKSSWIGHYYSLLKHFHHLSAFFWETRETKIGFIGSLGPNQNLYFLNSKVELELELWCLKMNWLTYVKVHIVLSARRIFRFMRFWDFSKALSSNQCRNRTSRGRFWIILSISYLKFAYIKVTRDVDSRAQKHFSLNLFLEPSINHLYR